ncbi:MAG: sulfur oxidation c-type cytochrome SoxA [Rhodospirillales bacterium]|jgi:sulfur-oxidizing protein SoxA|nr:sulfur oxidation c-type cytochrome SoxA [Rhodospirillales bacterium]
MNHWTSWRSFALIAGVAFAAAACSSVPEWTSQSIKESAAPIVEKDGKQVQIRYNEGPYSPYADTNWSKYRTLSYKESIPAPPVVKVEMPKDIKGDVAKGKKLFESRAKAPCTGCHVVRDDIWPMGDVGPSLVKFGDKKFKDEFVYQMIYDMRSINKDSFMPPWGASGAFTPEEIVHLVAYVQSQKGPPVKRKDPNIDPATRYVSEGFGDNLDPTNNPAIAMSEATAAKMWKKAGPNGKTCDSCHAGGAAKMTGVAAKWPRFVKTYNRVMAIEDFLGPHAKDTMGENIIPAQGNDNIHTTTAIKMASTGMAQNIDMSSPEMKEALERGKTSFYNRVGQRNHACADCHTEERGGGKFLGGRKLPLLAMPMNLHFPTYRTNFAKIWDMRKRFQWCTLPLGMNFIPGDSIEYAELELYLASFAQGKPLRAPGLGH